MSSLTKARSDPKRQLMHQLKDARTIMLSVAGAADEMQPMTAFVHGGEHEDDPAKIYFFTKTDSEIGAAEPLAAARICLVGKHHDYHACISGQVEPVSDPNLRDEFWSPAVAAWFPLGQTDPSLLMLEFVPLKADIWASTGNALLFGFEIMKANATGEEPNVGVRTALRFDQSAA